MGFLDDLRAYLQRPEPLQPGFRPELAAHRQHLLHALEQLQRRGEAATRVQYLHDHYSSTLESFVTTLGKGLIEGLGHDMGGDGLMTLIDIGIDRSLGLETSTGSKVKDKELDRLADKANLATFFSASSDREMAASYAMDIRAVRPASERWSTTPIGRLILDLPDRDAIRLMLASEAAQALDGDERRLSRFAANNLLKRPTGWLVWNDPDDALPIAFPILRRLSRMGLARLSIDYQHWVIDWVLLPSGREFLEEISSGEQSPFTILAEALLQDETAAVLGPYRSVAAMVQREGAAAATTRHARMVAHEIRNALVPVQAAVGALYRDVDRAAEPARLVSHRDAIEGGIARVFQFIKEMVEIAARGAEPASPFDLIPAIEEAIAAVAPELGIRASFSPPEALPPVIGHRNRLTMTMVNLLRNAAQAHGGPDAAVRIAASISPGGEEITVTVDDNGPGVPPAMREAIFRPGVSLRPGGSGEGLALVREVIEGELGGRASCEDGPGGGARFVLRIPVRGRGAGG